MSLANEPPPPPDDYEKHAAWLENDQIERWQADGASLSWWQRKREADIQFVILRFRKASKTYRGKLR